MQDRTIITVPADILNQPTKSIDNIDKSHISLIEDMKQLMHAHRGIGLAANQIGEQDSIIVIDLTNSQHKQSYPPFVLINPKITEILPGNAIMEEGCLSVPKLFLKIARPAKILVKGLNLDGKEVEIEAEDLLARVLLHEIDHLLGRHILDYLSVDQQKEYFKFISSNKNPTKIIS